MNESPNFQFPQPQYELFIYGMSDTGDEMVYRSSRISDSHHRVPAAALETSEYAEYRGFIRAVNPDDARNQFVNSQFFYFPKDL